MKILVGHRAIDTPNNKFNFLCVDVVLQRKFYYFFMFSRAQNFGVSKKADLTIMSNIFANSKPSFKGFDLGIKATGGGCFMDKSNGGKSRDAVS
jgi:hypothetical protein